MANYFEKLSKADDELSKSQQSVSDTISRQLLKLSADYSGSEPKTSSQKKTRNLPKSLSNI